MLQQVPNRICLECRLRLLPPLRRPRHLAQESKRTFVGQGATWPDRSLRKQATQQHARRRSNHYEAGTGAKEHIPGAHELDVRSTLDPEVVARHARRRFGDRLPEGALREEELRVYERMFGTPLVWEPHHDEVQTPGEELAAGVEDDSRDVLLEESGDGRLEQVAIVEEDVSSAEEEADGDTIDANGVIQEDIRAAIDAEPGIEPDEYTPEREDDFTFEPEESAEVSRAHPYTLASRSGTTPTTIELPKNSFVGPASVILSETKNKHLDDAAARCLGGPGLPYGSGTPRVSRTMQQKPTPLNAYQHRMSSIEADVYLASIMPGYYASSMSVLVEIRKRLGPDWLHNLLARASQGDGPSVLDAGAGGAGALAWRDFLRTEVQCLEDDGKMPADLQGNPAAIDGKVTVLTGNDELRHRASILLENTTFLPRLPDYFHLTPKPGAQSSAHTVEDGSSTPQARKQFDVVLAPHSLWMLKEDWQRREHIQNLWAMLNPHGGILVLLEKGVPRGFEVIAGARQYILEELLSNSESSKRAVSSGDEPPSEGKSRHAAPGAIVAPCTTQSKCPMYRFSGVSKQRKDYCHFSQRYLRPSYFQRLLGATNRNHEDVKFSYIAMQKGRLPEELGCALHTDLEGNTSLRDRMMGKEATDRAFLGYDVNDTDLAMRSVGRPGTDLQAQPIEQRVKTPEEHIVVPAVDLFQDDKRVHPAPHPMTLPHLVLPPLKRPRHVMLDLCTPAGTLERWTVPRSFGKSAYRDARKAAWGDGWALGAKTRELRKVRIGRSLGTVSGDVDQTTLLEGEEPGKKDKLKGRAKRRVRKRAEKKGNHERRVDEGELDELGP